MASRRLRILLVLALMVGSAGAAAAVAAPSRGPRARLSDYFTQADVERGRRYRGPVYALTFGGLAAALAAGAALGLGRGARWLGRIAEQATGGRWALEVLLLAAAVTIAIALVELPFGYGRYLHDRHWGLSTQSAAGYLGDVGKGAAFGLVVAWVTALGFFGIARALPRGWPAVAAGFAVGLTVLFTYILPVVYEPLFNRFTPVEPDVRRRILAIAERAGVTVKDVLVADASRRTTRQNAYVSGLGPTKRVVLYDTLLERSTPKQVDLVVAHELAHVAHNDVLKGTILASAGAVGAVVLIWRLLAWGALTARLGVAGPGDPRALPFIAFVLAVAALLSLPVLKAYSRRIEAAADRAAIDFTRDSQTAIEVEVSLARSNLSDLQPNRFVVWLFYSHPPALERIQIALDWRAAHAAGG